MRRCIPLILLAGCVHVSETFAPFAVLPRLLPSRTLHGSRTARSPLGGIRAKSTEGDLRGEFSKLMGESGREQGMKEIKAPKGSLQWLQQQSAKSPAAGPAASPASTQPEELAVAVPGPRQVPGPDQPSVPKLSGPPTRSVVKEKASTYAYDVDISEPSVPTDVILSSLAPRQAAPAQPSGPKLSGPPARRAYAYDVDVSVKSAPSAAPLAVAKSAVAAADVIPLPTAKPVRPLGSMAVPGVSDTTVLKSDAALTMFQMADQDGSGSLNKEDFEDLILSVEPDSSPEHMSSMFESIVCKEELCQESISFLGFFRWLNAESEGFAKKLVRQNYLFQAQLLFQEADTDGSGNIDAAELKVLGDALGLKWSRHDAKDVLKGLDKDGNASLDFDEFFDWFCSQTGAARDKTGAFASQLRLMLRSNGIEKRQVLITGFPFKANADGAERFFSRCGNIDSVKMLPWAKTGKPSGRFVIEFEDVEGAQAALQMHKKKMGARDIGVFRINVGDSEETMTIDRHLHSAILGPQGSFLKSMEAESGARIFLRYNATQNANLPLLPRILIVKGTPVEREAAKSLILQATDGGVATETITIPIKYKDVLLARKGRNLRRLESLSGAKVFIPKIISDKSKSFFAVKQTDIMTAENAVLQITGVIPQRIQAKAAIDELMRTWTDVVHPLPEKYHGTLKGKGAIVVQRVEQETGTTINFSKEDGGFMSISGQTASCEDAWTLMQFFKTKLPGLLTTLRSGSLAAGDLASVPMLEGKLDAELVWPIVLEEALMTFKKEMRLF